LTGQARFDKPKVQKTVQRLQERRGCHQRSTRGLVSPLSVRVAGGQLPPAERTTTETRKNKVTFSREMTIDDARQKE
jgi:hypothetical protein